MLEIKVGEYIRTKNGIIVKVLECDKEIGMYLCTDNKYKAYVSEENIVKYSKNIIDLLEVRDYVNGEKIKHIYTDYNKIETISETVNNFIHVSKIKSIVTKEQFTQAEYRIEE